EGGQGAGDPGEHERQRHRRAGLGGGGDPGEHEDAGADDDPDAEHGQVPGRKVLPELVVGLLGVPDRLLDRLGTQHAHPHRLLTARPRPTWTPLESPDTAFSPDTGANRWPTPASPGPSQARPARASPAGARARARPPRPAASRTRASWPAGPP